MVRGKAVARETERRAEAFNAGIESLLVFYAADVVCYPAPGWVEETVLVGHDAIRRLGAVWTENFDEAALEVHEVRDMQDRFLILAEFTGRARDSGRPLRLPFGVVNSNLGEDRKVGTVHFFLSWPEALDAVGLPA
jgi:hypothetical protein